MSMICSCEKDTAYCYMGNVDYKTENDINEWIKNVNNLSIRDFWAIAKESFFIKRDNFSHEKEIRLIYALDSDSKVKNYLTFEINQNILFDEFCIDPRCSDSEFNIIKNKLMQNGVVKNKIIKSKLYEFTPLILNFS